MDGVSYVYMICVQTFRNDLDVNFYSIQREPVDMVGKDATNFVPDILKHWFMMILVICDSLCLPKTLVKQGLPTCSVLTIWARHIY